MVSSLSFRASAEPTTSLDPPDDSVRKRSSPDPGIPSGLIHFNEGDDGPRALCPIHRGSFKQNARRAVGRCLVGLGRKLKGIFED